MSEAAYWKTTDDVWTFGIEVWPRRKWLPFEWTVWNHKGPGRGWFHGSCWRVIPILNGRRSPFVPEGVGWACTEDRAIRKASKEARERERNQRN